MFVPLNAETTPLVPTNTPDNAASVIVPENVGDVAKAVVIAVVPVPVTTPESVMLWFAVKYAAVSQLIVPAAVICK
jgi:hypothetical protein